MPRSGSTLLQRLLLSHKAIGGAAEPWILLPLVYMKKQQGIISEYSSRLSSKALNDLLNDLKNGEELFYEQIKNFADGIYIKALKKNEIYFLDKTPRYYLIIDELYKIYPNAKFIYLFRNPTHIYASILTTWCNNQFTKLYGNHNDLVFGFNKISEAFSKHQENENTFSIKYEDLVSQPKKIMMQIQKFLEIEYDDSLTENFINSSIDKDKKEKLGDPLGVKLYNSINLETLKKWERVFNTRFRKFILKKYVSKTLTNQNLEIQGYSLEIILKEINLLNNNGKFNIFIDIFNYFLYKLIIKFNLYNYISKDMKWSKDKFMS